MIIYHQCTQWVHFLWNTYLPRNFLICSTLDQESRYFRKKYYLGANPFEKSLVHDNNQFHTKNHQILQLVWCTQRCLVRCTRWIHPSWASRKKESPIRYERMDARKRIWSAAADVRHRLRRFQLHVCWIHITKSPIILTKKKMLRPTLALVNILPSRQQLKHVSAIVCLYWIRRTKYQSRISDQSSTFQFRRSRIR